MYSALQQRMSGDANFVHHLAALRPARRSARARADSEKRCLIWRQPKNANWRGADEKKKKKRADARREKAEYGQFDGGYKSSAETNGRYKV